MDRRTDGRKSLFNSLSNFHDNQDMIINYNNTQRFIHKEKIIKINNKILYNFYFVKLVLIISRKLYRSIWWSSALTTLFVRFYELVKIFLLSSFIKFDCLSVINETTDSVDSTLTWIVYISPGGERSLICDKW